MQRGMLGINNGCCAGIAEDMKLAVNQGVLIREVNGGSAAEQSGLSGDVIVGINGHAVSSVSGYEWVARNRPGGSGVSYIQKRRTIRSEGRLRNSEGNECGESC